MRDPDDGSVINELVAVDFEVLRSIGVEIRRTST